MNTWTYRNIDYSKAKAGDVIVENGEIIYIREIRTISNKNGRAISPEYRVTLGDYRHRFDSIDMPGAGFSFPVDENGGVDNTFGWLNRIEELKKNESYTDLGIEYSERSFYVPAVIRCQCGAEVELSMVMTNTCDKCHRDYNSSGQLLAPRSQWGWDTGESLSDILNADWHINDPGPGHEGYDDLSD